MGGNSSYSCEKVVVVVAAVPHIRGSKHVHKGFGGSLAWPAGMCYANEKPSPGKHVAVPATRVLTIVIDSLGFREWDWTSGADKPIPPHRTIRFGCVMHSNEVCLERILTYWATYVLK